MDSDTQLVQDKEIFPLMPTLTVYHDCFKWLLLYIIIHSNISPFLIA